MAELTGRQFASFFAALWQRPPFAWQQALAERVLGDGRWPGAIALPTAAGKTACLDIALFALAAQASRAADAAAVTAPRRIFLVVDRRIIVDEAFERAREIAARLGGAEGGILGEVAAQLRRLAGGGAAAVGAEPLRVHLLRGGVYRSEAWAGDPLQPAIICSTVDQLGSRLLFRAYGRGPGMWPVYAALAAHDSLILLDEAHCARPFLATLQAVARYQRWADRPIGRPFTPVVLSATPPPGLDCFVDPSGEPRDPDHPLGRRQLAAKPVELLGEVKGKGAKAIPELAKALAEAALALAKEERRAVVVFVNRVATARAVRDRLVRSGAGAVTLLTGRMRPIDKGALVEGPLAGLKSAGAADRRLDRPHFVVATQTLEVGADLDFDALVTECAPLDALRQRFGRLNRMGRPIAARAAIAIRADQAAEGSDDPVYGPALGATWRWLRQEAAKGPLDFGIAALAPRLPEGAALEGLNAPAPPAPVLLPSHLDLWAQSSPAPQPSPDPAPFLHGERHAPAEISVCWRADLTVEDRGRWRELEQALALCPPTAPECLPVPLAAFRRWMAGEELIDDSADVEGAGPEEPAEAARGERPVRFVLAWRGQESRVLERPEEVRPGEVIAIPTAWGGAGQLGDLPPVEGPALDLGDEAQLIARGQPLLRLSAARIFAWPDTLKAKAAGRALGREIAARYKQLQQGDRPDLDALHEPLAELLALIASDEAESPERRRIAAALRGGRPRLHLLAGTLLVVGRRRLPPEQRMGSEAEPFSDEEDREASAIARPDGAPVRLRHHLAGVAAFARRFARGTGLPPPLAEAVERAALLHDLGKVDRRFQALLAGGNPWLAGGEPLAKSGELPRDPIAAEEARTAAGYPKHARHELLSVRLALSAPACLPADEELRDLVLHLIASHHGRCRPFAPAEGDGDEALEHRWCFDDHTFSWRGPTGLERLEAGVADRFWRLTRRYGFWGLAWLEALVRLADHRRSEWEERHSDEI